MVDLNTIHSLLEYDREAGAFHWRVKVNSRSHVGARADHPMKIGYRRISIGGVKYYAHRIAWLIVHGAEPLNGIDHINGNRGDNRILNLRDVTQAINTQNTHIASRANSTGLIGVSRFRGKFKAEIRIDGRKRYLGTFAEPEDAHQAYLAAKRRHHAGCTI